MKVLHKAIGLAVMMAFFCVGPTVLAKTILYVPQDNRPVDYAYTIETARDAGYTMIVPPTELLSGSSFQGSPEQLMNNGCSRCLKRQVSLRTACRKS